MRVGYSTRALLLASTMIITSQAAAEEVSFEFSADLAYSYGSSDHPEFYGMFGGSTSGGVISNGGTLSGTLTYDTAVPSSTVNNWYPTEFDFLNAPSLTNELSVDELSHTFQLDWAGLAINGNDHEVQIISQAESVSTLQGETVGFDFYFYDDDGELLSNSSTLPSDIDLNLTDNFEPELFIFGDNGQAVALASLTAFFSDVGNNQEPTVDADGNLILGATQSDSFTLETGEVLSTNKTVVGQYETSSFLQQGGAHTTDDLFIGGDQDENYAFEEPEGSYELQDGTLTTDLTTVGYHGPGLFTQSGGIHSTDQLWLGNVGQSSSITGPRAIGVGTYNMLGGDLEAGNGIAVGLAGQGTINQSGGSVVAGRSHISSPLFGMVLGGSASRYDPDNFSIPTSEQRYGAYDLSGGDLTVFGDMIVGDGADIDDYVTPQIAAQFLFGGKGEVSQSGGTAFVRDDLVLGKSGTANSGEGQYTLSDGLLTVGGNLKVADTSAGGKAAEGTFLQTGGTVNVSGDIVIGEGAAGVTNAYRVQGGSTSASQVVVGLAGGGNSYAVLEVSSSGQLTGDVSINENGKMMGSGGLITGNVTLNGGLLAPGSSPGTMTIDGDFIHNSGVLELEWLSSGRDLLIVEDDIAIGENALIDIVLDFVPTLDFALEDFFQFDDLFEIAEGFDVLSNISFSFTGGVDEDDVGSLGLSVAGDVYNFVFNGSGGPATDVPEPAALALFGFGLAGIGFYSRRRRHGVSAT